MNKLPLFANNKEKQKMQGVEFFERNKSIKNKRLNARKKSIKNPYGKNSYRP